MRPKELDDADRRPNKWRHFDAALAAVDLTACAHEWHMPTDPLTVRIEFCRLCGTIKPLHID